MKRIIFIFSVLLLISVATRTVAAQDLLLHQTKASGLYSRGETISVYAISQNSAGDSVRIRVLKNNTREIVKRSAKISGDSLLVYSGSFDESCSLIVEVRNKGGAVSLGALVDPENLKSGAKIPDDFKKYWKGLKKLLADSPATVIAKEVPGFNADKAYSCVDIEISTPGRKPARGYFAKPEGKPMKSLPAVLLVHAAGVKGSWCRSEPGNAMNYAKKGAICFDLNAHGMLNGQPESYYADLENGELKNYQLQGVESRDDFYFRDMYLRLLRAIDFLASQPEWDGKRIIVIGESQGGGQALAAAGLDKRISAAVAIVPAMCDWFGPLADRRGGWPQPYESGSSKEKILKSIPYFDNVNILKGSKATIVVEIGLIDMTCPSTSVYAAVNQASGRKIIYTVPYRPHQTGPLSVANMRTWQETVNKQREKFINDYLK